MSTEESTTTTPTIQIISSDKDRIKFNHYFMSGKCYLSVIGLKNAPNDKRKVDFIDEDKIHIVVELNDGSIYDNTFDLFGKIDVNNSKFNHFPSKIELILPMIPIPDLDAWPRLLKENISSYDTNRVSTDFKGTLTSKGSAKSYSDWDKISYDMNKNPEEPDGNLNKFFQQIFANADEDTRKAMMKSYTESGGTVLSTNWKEVGSKRVDPSPPSSMEVKSYEK